MANETVIETHDDEMHENAQNQISEGERLWGGGEKPFKASYGKLMMWYFLLSDAFTFGGFLIAYGALRFSVEAWPVPDFVFSTAPFGITHAPLIFVTFMTFVLIVSSVTVLRAVQEGKRENKNPVITWLLITIVGGGIFLGSQAWEWTNLISTEGMTVFTNPFSAHTIEKGEYMTFDELKAYAAEEGWTEAEMQHEGSDKTTTYFIDGEGNTYFEKRDHHGHLPEDMNIEYKTPYLITYNHDFHDYAPGAYEVKNEAGEVTAVKSEEFGPKAFGTLFFFITGFHGFHVLSGLVILLIVAINVYNGTYAPRKNGYETVEKVGLYWHFVDLVWVFVFLAFYLL